MGIEAEFPDFFAWHYYLLDESKLDSDKEKDKKLASLRALSENIAIKLLTVVPDGRTANEWLKVSDAYSGVEEAFMNEHDKSGTKTKKQIASSVRGTVSKLFQKIRTPWDGVPREGSLLLLRVQGETTREITLLSEVRDDSKETVTAKDQLRRGIRERMSFVLRHVHDVVIQGIKPDPACHHARTEICFN